MVDAKSHDSESSNIKRDTDATESVICETNDEEDEMGKGDGNESNKEKEESVIHKIDTGEMTNLDISCEINTGVMMNLDISCDLVIDESVGLSENNRKSVSFDLEQKGKDVNSAGTSFEGIEENVQKGHEQDEQDSTNVNETITSTDPIVEDEFDSEDDIPL